MRLKVVRIITLLMAVLFNEENAWPQTRIFPEADADNFALIDYAVHRRSPWPVFHHDSRHTGQSGHRGPQAADLKWKYTDSEITEGAYPNSPSISHDGSTIYVTAGNRLLAMDTSSGQVTWSAAIEVGGGATAVASDGTVYAVGDTKLYAFTSSGASEWVFAEPTDVILGEPNIGRDGTIYIGSWDTYVYAVRSDETLKWKYKTDGSIAPLASPTLSPDGSTVYVGSGDPNKTPDGTLYALNSSDGTLKWKVKVSQVRASGAVVGSDGTVYVTGSGRVNALDSSGTVLWQSEQNTAGSLTPALSYAGIVYVGTGPEGKIFAIDARNGDTLWSYQTGQNPDPEGPEYGVLTAPAIGADGTVYVGSVDGKMYALKPDGTLLWAYQTGASIVENSPAIGKDGTLYFSSMDKYLYAIKARR
ncbi:MAG: PQQ-binding-like beta-propeller repeat protein [Candidatus Rokubacteria bacterium]|nr:PQQ-binding-like beta-propeller repeat protein [Candidatus Rokubacteria bacterium]